MESQRQRGHLSGLSTVVRTLCKSKPVTVIVIIVLSSSLF